VKRFDVVYNLDAAQKIDLLYFFQNEWWSDTRTEGDLETILKGSSFIVGMLDPDDGRLVAFSRVLTDTFMFAYIYDVIVLRGYRRQGLGKLLIETTLAHPMIKNIKSVELICMKELIPFYQNFGFTTDYGFSVSMRRWVDPD